jgi:hypothetical protein
MACCVFHTAADIVSNIAAIIKVRWTRSAHQHLCALWWGGTAAGQTLSEHTCCSVTSVNHCVHDPHAFRECRMMTGIGRWLVMRQYAKYQIMIMFAYLGVSTVKVFAATLSAASPRRSAPTWTA